jgi:acyl-CoA synthetase (NDP forming)
LLIESAKFDLPADTVLSWTRTNALLAEYDIDLVPTKLTVSPEEALKAVHEFSCPIVLKAIRPMCPTARRSMRFEPD